MLVLDRGGFLTNLFILSVISLLKEFLLITSSNTLINSLSLQHTDLSI